MDLGYSNDMINSTTGRMTTEYWMKLFFYTSVILWSFEKVGGFLKSGCDRQRIFSMGNHFPHDIIIFPLGYKIETIFSQLPFFFVA